MLPSRRFLLPINSPVLSAIYSILSCTVKPVFPHQWRLSKPLPLHRHKDRHPDGGVRMCLSELYALLFITSLGLMSLDSGIFSSLHGIFLKKFNRAKKLE